MTHRADSAGWRAPWRGALPLAIVLCAAADAQAATPVDWLAFQPGADRSHFGLLDDAGALTLQCEIEIVAGVFGPTSPAASLLQAPFWVTTPDFTDSLLGDSTVATTKVQVAPQGGSVHYRLTLTGTNLAGLTLAIGQLFGTATGGTRDVEIAAETAGGASAPIALLDTHAWDDGIRFYTQSVGWDAAAQRLSLAPGAIGESEFAFLALPSGGPPITSLTLTIPSGHTSAAGDAVEFAFGIAPVPEPAGIALLAQGLAWLGCARRRSRR